MDLLAVNDQENRVHAFQAGAAAKQLNQGLKAAKTPAHKAPKTPFKIPLNDENAITQTVKTGFGKTNGKGNENLLTVRGKQTGKLDKQAFITPAGPRNRAPLGMKTTNAKTNAFQTPAPLTEKTSKVSPRLRRPKVKVHQPEPAQDVQEEEEREIEYMPPKEIPLPDELDDLPSDWKFPMFEGANLTRGIVSTYFNPVGDDGLTKWEREEKEALERGKKESDEAMERMFAEINGREVEEIRRSFGLSPVKKPIPKPELPRTNKVSGPSTVKSKTAAALLSPTRKPSYAAPTASAKSKTTRTLLPAKSSKPAPNNPSAVRHATASAASKSTIGYGHNRSTSTSLRKPLPNLTSYETSMGSTRKPQAPGAKPKSRAPFSRSSSTSTNATLVAAHEPETSSTFRTEDDIDRELRFLALSRELEEDDGEVDAWMNNFMQQANGGIDDEYEGFQLQLPEGL